MSKENLHFDNQTYYKLFSFFSSRCFLKEIENMYFVFLSSYANTHESLGELEKAVDTAFLVLPNFHPHLYLTNRFHVAVTDNRMTSKCGKNKKVAHEA